MLPHPSCEGPVVKLWPISLAHCDDALSLALDATGDAA
jgi:hypothetical protein